MDVICDVKGRNLVVHINGELDHHNSEYTRDKIDRCYTKENAKNLIFDFSGIDFMDSSGIGLIMGRYRKVINMGGKVGLINVSPQLDRIFSLSGLYKIIEKYLNIDEAIKLL